MKQAIQEKLTHIAHSEPLHFLLAVESGSRAWGFASPDSDYDVRAIYIRPQQYYLQIDEAKDTFEFIENQWFDVGGWDIRKTLRLLRKSNAVLLEWLRSPIVYTQDDDFTGRLNALAPQYVQAAALLHHYRGIAGNALRNMDLAQPVKLKKWFYVLRPLLLPICGTVGSQTRRDSANDAGGTDERMANGLRHPNYRFGGN